MGCWHQVADIRSCAHPSNAEVGMLENCIARPEISIIFGCLAGVVITTISKSIVTTFMALFFHYTYLPNLYWWISDMDYTNLQLNQTHVTKNGRPLYIIQRDMKDTIQRLRNNKRSHNIPVKHAFAPWASPFRWVFTYKTMEVRYRIDVFGPDFMMFSCFLFFLPLSIGLVFC